MGSSSGTAGRVMLASLLVALGLAVSVSLPPTFLLGGGAQTQNNSLGPEGRLTVTVTLRNGSAPPTPVAGVGVGISQLVAHGIQAVFTTNRTGEVSIAASQGAYGISVADPRFSISTVATVLSGEATWVKVDVNRTSLYADFTQAQDSTSEEQIGPWNQVVVEVTPSNFVFPFGLWTLGSSPYVVVGNLGGTAALPHFGDQVFLQPLSFDGPLGGLAAAGPEVAATVVSQVPAAQTVWLTLRPQGILDMSGSYFLSVVTYSAASSESRTNA